MPTPKSSPPEEPADDAAARYRDFWHETGSAFPDLDGARSTRQYLDDERWLFRRYFSPLPGKRMLKTDLWDEGKNTRILRWAAAGGMTAFGVDISPPIVRLARQEFDDHRLRLRGAISDVRTLPFVSGSFDAVYSMGTIEHFDETDTALREIYRVLTPGGVAVIGVPNRLDPFLRPALVACLYRLGLYGYGFEKSYTRRTLRAMLERTGFEITDETGILFIPGWLRMLDLACHAWLGPLSTVSGAAVAPFAYLSRRFPRLRRHGYLLAAVVRKPE